MLTISHILTKKATCPLSSQSSSRIPQWDSYSTLNVRLRPVTFGTTDMIIWVYYGTIREVFFPPWHKNHHHHQQHPPPPPHHHQQHPPHHHRQQHHQHPPHHHHRHHFVIIPSTNTQTFSIHVFSVCNTFLGN